MRKFELVEPTYRRYETEQLPRRADRGSCGYDFYTPISFSIKPNETYTLMTDIKVKMEENELLLIFVRSSVGIRRRIGIIEGTSVIDASYYSNPINDGNISLVLINYGDETQHFTKGDRIAQGVFLKYLTTEDDEPIHTNRIGGIGSSGQ